MPSEKILVIEDEKNLSSVLTYNLKKEGYRVAAAADGEAGLAAFRKGGFDLLILDLMLPKLDGFEVCKAVRKDSATPILMLTARKEEVDRILGLELGADDYVTKPFSVRELMARVKAVLRRVSGKPSKGDVVRAGALEIDLPRYETRLNGRAVSLRSKEFDLLKCLAEADGKALSREELLEKVWGQDKSAGLDTRTIDQHVARLRDKLGREAGRVVTVKNVGYRLKTEES